MKKIKSLILTMAGIFLVVSLCIALPGTKQWKAAWDANTESDLAGYMLYYSASSGSYADANSVDCGNVTEYNLDSIATGSYLVLTAYDTSGNESDFSGEVHFLADTVAPVNPGGLAIVEQ